MSCLRFESWMALYVEGDLPARQARALEAHLDGCAPCREFAGELVQSQSKLKSLRGELVDESALAAVRLHVLKKIAQPVSQGLIADWWRYAAAAGLAAGLAMMIFWATRTHPQQPFSEPVAITPPSPPPAVTPGNSLRKPPLRSKPRVIQAKRATEPKPAAPLLVQMLTEDPNVVVYWLIEPKESSE